MHFDTKFFAGTIFCGNCNKYIDAKHYSRHTRDVHGTNNQVKCPMCQKIFKNDSSCQKHLRVIHNVYRSWSWMIFYQITGQVYCQTCDKNVSAKNFVRHMKDVHASAEEAVTCPYCSKNYKNRNSLQVHIKHQHVQHVQSFNWNTNLKKNNMCLIYGMVTCSGPVLILYTPNSKDPTPNSTSQGRSSVQLVCDGTTTPVSSATNRNNTLVTVST